MIVKPICAMLLSVLCLASSHEAAAADVRLQASALGWYSNAGVHQAFNVNTLTGPLAGNEYRSFYVWNLPLINGVVTSARIEFDIQYSLGVSGTLVQNGRIFDVSPANVGFLSLENGGGQGASLFSDLGNGSTFGDFSVGPSNSLSIFSVPLNSSALGILSGAAGQTFAVGMRNVTAGNFDNYFLFSSQSFPASQTLVLTVQAVPEPSTVLMTLAGVVGVLCAAGKRKRVC